MVPGTGYILYRYLQYYTVQYVFGMCSNNCREIGYEKIVSLKVCECAKHYNFLVTVYEIQISKTVGILHAYANLANV
jgi:hypothetical protein